MALYEFDVVGIPTPQGSKQAFVRGGRAVIVDAGASSSRQRHAQWRAAVADKARVAKGDQPTLDGPIAVELRFWMPVVKSDPYRTRHITTPDVDKLVRAVLDSLTNSAMIRDDSQVYSVDATKFYAPEGHWTGVGVVIFDTTDLENRQREVLKTRTRAKKRVIESK